MTSPATVLDLVSRLAPQGARVLDAGCGDGALTVALTRAGFVAIGLDQDLEAIRPAADENPRIPFYLDDLTDLELPMALVGRGFDVVVLKDVLDGMGLAELDAVLATTARLAAPDGVLVVTVPDGTIGTVVRTAEKAGWSESTRETADGLILVCRRRAVAEPEKKGRLASLLRR